MAMSEDYRAGLEANLNYVARLQQDVDQSGASEDDKVAFQASIEQRFLVRWGRDERGMILICPVSGLLMMNYSRAASTQDWLAKNKRMREVGACLIKM